MDIKNATTIANIQLHCRQEMARQQFWGIWPLLRYQILTCPACLGLAALQKDRAVLDLSSLKLHSCGPGDIKIDAGLPPGTETFQLGKAPSGHIVLPCCEYEKENLGQSWQ